MNASNYNPLMPLTEQYSAAMVVGLGATGLSAIRYLRGLGLTVSVVDSRSAPPQAQKLAQLHPEVQMHCGDFNSAELVDAEFIVCSPGVALNEPVLRSARAAGAHIVGDIELFLQANTAPLIAITGSNGKSTVTELVGNMLRAAGKKPLVAGNIGVPALDALTDGREFDIAVLELSSFQLETTSQVPAAAAAILNVSADHMDRYPSMGDYLLAKARILRGAEIAVLPRHDEQLQQITQVSRRVTFDLDEPANDDEFGLKRASHGRWLMRGEQRLMKLSDISLIGLHNVKNVLAAFALVDFLQLPLAPLVGAVKAFKGLPHRMQTVAQAHDVVWVNDSKATNIGATSTALSNLESSVIWIAGGQGKGADFKALSTAVSANIKKLILFGEDAELIAQALASKLPIVQVVDMRAAVELAGDEAVKGDIVLLSPACASFDMYSDFAARGDDFARLAQAYIARSAA